MSTLPKRLLKDAGAVLPAVPEAYQRYARGLRPPTSGYPLDRLLEAIPGWARALEAAEDSAGSGPPKSILVMGCLRWWLEYAVALGVMLRSRGHRVDLAFLPYKGWDQPTHPFDDRRQSQLIQQVLDPLKPWIGTADLSQGPRSALGRDAALQVEELSRIDVQYTRLREDIDTAPNTPDGELMALRRERNVRAAERAQWVFRANHYDVVVIPNGSILEFSAVYHTALRGGVLPVTYEFGEQRDRLWLAQGDEVMRQDTRGLWQAVGDIPLTEEEQTRIDGLYSARRGGRTWKNFGRTWQPTRSVGAQSARHRLDLDSGRKVVLLCTNIVGDSLALGRQVFTRGMADWLASTAQLFLEVEGAQLVVRVHPGEVRLVGQPSVDIVREAVPHVPGHVKLVPPDSEINTYDLMELADIGLVYTTTVGMEMAMMGIPVITAGETHYRGKGFTHDPGTWEEYRRILFALIGDRSPRGLSQAEIQLAWRYAYRFFFNYPFPFPWHLVHFWDDQERHPLAEEIRSGTSYERTLRAFAGEPIDWVESLPSRDREVTDVGF